MTRTVRTARLTLFAILIGVVGVAVQPSLAATVQVGTCLSGVPHYSTIQAAVNASAPGSTVRICPGNYPEQVVIGKTLALTGIELNTGSTVVITPPVGGIVQNATGLSDSSAIGAQILVQGATGVSITGLTVDGAGNQLSCTLDFMGIYYQNASGVINFVVTRNQNLGTGSQCQSGQGIFAQSGYGFSGSSGVVIENSHVYGYQKNGVSADGNALAVNITGNDVVGQGPTPYVAQNGIEITGDAKGKILNNSVSNNIYSGSSFSATGILVYASSGLSLEGNTVSNTQGIVIYSGGTAGSADQTSIISNRVSDTDTYDAIDVCSNGNTLISNVIMGSSQGGIHLDDTCVELDNSSSGKDNTATANRINDVCAGVLLGSGTGNTTSPNAVWNADYARLAGDSCSVTPSGNAAQVLSGKRRPRPSIVRP